MREVKIGLLGVGTVGSGVYETIEIEQSNIEHKEGVTLCVKKALALVYPDYVPESKRAKNIDEIVDDPEIEVVVELMGGMEPAKTFILKALAAGKSVVSANKHLIARCWPELELAAKNSGAGFYFEASVGGGIPLLRTIIESLNANSITEVFGIINGTTNYILSKMSEEGRDYADVLKEAQDLGFAEADPTSDVEGLDAANKLAILASMAFHARVPLESVYTEGITRVTPEDIDTARRLGYAIKLLAIGKKVGTQIEVRVHPTMIPLDHPLSSVRGAFNAVFIHGNIVDDVMLYGQGAGKFPTASAVVSDIILAATTPSHRYMTFKNEYNIPPTTTFENDWRCAFYITLEVKNEAGVLSQISSVFAKYGVSISSVLQQGKNDYKTVPLVFITQESFEVSIKNAVDEIKYLPSVLKVKNTIRVEDR